VGSQNVPYIYEDYSSVCNVAKAIERMHGMDEESRTALGTKAREYALSEFSHQKTIDLWHETMLKVVEDWKKEKPKRWKIQEVGR
jgi:hypothetical protein